MEVARLPALHTGHLYPPEAESTPISLLFLYEIRTEILNNVNPSNNLRQCNRHIRIGEATDLQTQAVIVRFTSLELGFELPAELSCMGPDDFKL